MRGGRVRAPALFCAVGKSLHVPSPCPADKLAPDSEASDIGGAPDAPASDTARKSIPREKNFMRLPTLKYEELTPRQRESWDKHSARRETVRGPYTVWLHDPDLMDKVSAVSNYFRFDCALPVKLREFGILVTARYWDAQYSWNAHVEKARAAGIPEDVIRDLAAGKKPQFKADDERVFYDFTMEALENHFVSRKTFDEAKKI